jgi:hypothetical protein
MGLHFSALGKLALASILILMVACTSRDQTPTARNPDAGSHSNVTESTPTSPAGQNGGSAGPTRPSASSFGPQTTTRTIPLDYEIGIALHDSAHLYLIDRGNNINNGPLPHLLIVEASTPGSEHLLGEAKLPQFGTKLRVDAAGIYDGQFFLLIDWLAGFEGGGPGPDDPIYITQLFKKPTDSLLDGSVAWSPVGLPDKSYEFDGSNWGNKTIFDEGTPYVYTLASGDQISELYRMDLRTGKEIQLAKDLPGTTMAITDNYIVLTTIVIEWSGKRMGTWVLDKSTLSLTQTTWLGYTDGIRGVGDRLYAVLLKGGMFSGETSLQVRSGPSLSLIRNYDNELRVDKTPVLGHMFLSYEGDYDDPVTHMHPYTARLTDPVANQSCQVAKFESKNWIETQDLIQGNHPRAVFTGQSRDADELVIVDLGTDHCPNRSAMN